MRMERIYKLPLMLGCLAALVAGISGYASGMDNSDIYIRMAVMMVTFFVLGLYVRNSVLSIKKELSEKKKNDALKKKEESKKHDEPKKQNEPAKGQELKAPERQEEESAGKENGEENDGFTPLNISKAIRTKISE